jgi:2-polyprenyl-6-methoxyphenol hydroxylase-like FAD-dependent oxidoreductase
VYWFAVADAPPGGTSRADDVVDELSLRFAGWHKPIAAILEATPAEKIVRTDIADRAPLARWSAGRVVLLGDAAHPMTPNLGQGGCQAIEDAVVLDACLAAHDADLPAALADYQRRRVARANRVVVESRRIGAVAQWSNPVAVALRSALLRATPASSVAGRLRRSLRFEV